MGCGVARRTEKPFSLRWRTALAVSSRTIRGDPHERDREPFDNGRRERLTATLAPNLTMAQRTRNDSSAPIPVARSAADFSNQTFVDVYPGPNLGPADQCQRTEPSGPAARSGFVIRIQGRTR